jgi:PAS domain S-box-containing protein
MISIDAFRSDAEPARHLLAALACVGDALVALDDRWNVVYLNPAARRVFEIPAGEWVGRSFWEACPQATGSVFEQQYRRAARERVTVEFEAQCPHLDRWFAVRAEPAVGGLVVYAHDVTDARRDRAALAAGESRLRLALTAADMIAWETDPVTGRVTMSDGAERIWGAREGQSDEFRQRLHPDDRQRVFDEWEAAVRAGGVFASEFRVTREDGAMRWIASRGHVVHAANGQAERVFGVMTDVTERRRAEAELRQAKEIAEGANRAKDHFLAVLSHELRTPLTPVLMAAASLEAEDGLPANVRQDLAMIRRNVELETRLIDDLLDLSRIVNGTLMIRLADLSLHSLLRNVGEMVAPEVVARDLVLQWDLGAAREQVRVDAARMHQVVWNLLKNAIKFTPRGGRITLRTDNPFPGRVRVNVIDTGVGIEPGVLPRIFDAFDQGEHGLCRRFGGMGLGLAIAKAIADMHGAALSAHSAGKNCGATFTLEMANAVAPAAVDLNVDVPPGGAAGMAVRPPRVLLVEDHPDTRNTLRRLLEGYGFAVEVAASMAAAVSAAGSNGFDVLVSDIGLPDGTGNDLMREFRVRYGEVEGIAVSGFGMEDDIRRSREAGFREHLTKPVNVRELLAAIGAAVARRANSAAGRSELGNQPA